MCLLVFAYKAHPVYPLVIAANRDEFLERPSLPADPWQEAPHIIAGRDQRAGGTWMGMTRSGYLAALTNYRDMHRPAVNGPSRGLLVRATLERCGLPENAFEYEGFNLVHGYWDDLRYHNNIDGTSMALPPGIHGLSNHLLNTPWPKVRRAGEALRAALVGPTIDPKDLFSLLMDTTPAPEQELPDTGVGPERERMLGTVFIRSDGYGTRCSTVILVDVRGEVLYLEHGHHPVSDRAHRFTIPGMECGSQPMNR